MAAVGRALDVQPAASALRRAFARPGAGRHPRHLRLPRHHHRRRHDRRAGRAGHQPRARCLGAVLLLAGRPSGADRADQGFRSRRDHRGLFRASGPRRMDWVNILIQGALLGGFYALFAIGLSMSFGIMRLVNIAHGDLIVLAAYVALVVTEAHRPRSVLEPRHRRAGDVRARLCVAARAAQSDAERRAAAAAARHLRHLHHHPERLCCRASAPTTIGFRRARSRPRACKPRRHLCRRLSAAWCSRSRWPAIAGLQFLFYRTRLGRAFRAISDDADTAELMGIDNRKLYARGASALP